MISHGVKTAAPSIRDKLVDQRAGLVNQQLWQNILKYLGIGAGVGLVGRGAQGLYNMGRRQLATPTPLLNAPKLIAVPAEEEDKNKQKVAWDLVTPVKDFFAGENATDWKGHPLAIPGVIAGTGAGMIGGWKLMDYILDKQRKAEQKGELEKAKQEYEAALQSQYKRGSALGQDLDRLFDLLQETEKSASSFGDTMGQAAGIAMVPMGALAIASGIITHNIASKRRQKALLEKAMAKRRRENALINPTRIYALPRPIAPSGALNSAPSEDEMDGSPLDKAAMDKEAYPPGFGPLSSSRDYYAVQRAKAERYNAQQRAERDRMAKIRHDRALARARERAAQGGSYVTDSGQIIGRASERGQQIGAAQAGAAEAGSRMDEYRTLMEEANNFIRQRDALRAAGDTTGEQALYQSAPYQNWAQRYSAYRQPEQAAPQTQLTSAGAEPVAPTSGFSSLPSSFQKKYYDNFAAGRTMMNEQQAYDYYRQHYAGTPKAQLAETRYGRRPVSQTQTPAQQVAQPARKPAPQQPQRSAYSPRPAATPGAFKPRRPPAANAAKPATPKPNMIANKGAVPGSVSGPREF